eukprot:s3398_g4.t1
MIRAVEAIHGSLGDAECPSPDYLSLKAEETETNEPSAAPLDEILSKQAASSSSIQSAVDSAGHIRITRTKTKAKMPSTTEEYRRIMKTEMFSWLAMASRYKAKHWLHGLTAAPFLKFVEFILGDRVYGIQIPGVDGAMQKVRPDWGIILAFEHKLRREAMKRVLAGHTLADALDSVIHDADLKEAFFTTPVALKSAAGDSQPNKWQRSNFKGSFGGNFSGKSSGSSFKGKSKGKGKGKSSNASDSRLKGLNLAWRTPDGRELCFAWNTGECDGTAEPSGAVPSMDKGTQPSSSVPVVKVMYLFAGKRRHSDVAAYLRQAEAAGKIRLILKEFDIERSPDHDLSDASLWKEIFETLEEGNWVVIVSPPCNTFSRARFQFRQHPGPKPLRTKAWPRGFPWLGNVHKKLVAEANFFVEQCLRACDCAASVGGWFLLEHPEDLGLVEGEHPGSIWQWPEVLELIPKFSAVDQGASEQSQKRSRLAGSQASVILVLSDDEATSNAVHDKHEEKVSGTVDNITQGATSSPAEGTQGTTASDPMTSQCEDDQFDLQACCNSGMPIQVEWDQATHSFVDGFGLCSPTRWRPQQRGERRTPEMLKLAGGTFEILSRAVSKHVVDVRQEAFKLVTGKIESSPFSAEVLNELRDEWTALLPDPADARVVDEGQPFLLRALSQWLKVYKDPDVHWLVDETDSFASGVYVGVGKPLPRSPQVFPLKTKHRKLDETEFAPIAENYPSAQISSEELEKKFREEEQLGRMHPSKLGVLKQEYGDRLRIAAMAAIAKPDGSVRPLHDATHSVMVNHEIVYRDKILCPGPSEIAAIVREATDTREATFCVSADIKAAHRLVKIRKADWGLLCCKANSSSDTVWVNRTGTFGVSSAPYWWAKLVAMIGRFVGYLFHTRWMMQMIYVDDLHGTFIGAEKFHFLWVWLLAFELIGTPFGYHKFKGGFSSEFVGFHIRYDLSEVGISKKRGDWLVDWIAKASSQKFVVASREFVEFLGRLGFVAQYGLSHTSLPFLLGHRPREENTEADDLTNEKFDAFEESKRIHMSFGDFDMPILRSLVETRDEFEKLKENAKRERHAEGWRIFEVCDLRRCDVLAISLEALRYLLNTAWSVGTLAKRRLLNIWTLILDFMYLGRWPSLDELRRSPSIEQLAVFDRLWTMMTVCGDARDVFPLCPGRTGPELGAHLFQLEQFCDTCPEFASGYMSEPCRSFCADPGLLSAADHPELLPYRSLDVDRLKLVGEGKWPMASFLSGPLWLPFQEPAFLCHGLDVSSEGLPNFSAEKPQECMRLALLWDARGLLHLEEQPLKPGYFSRVFNAYKDSCRDRQIGDRRLPNMCEFHVDGPSKYLPQGRLLTKLRIPRFTHCVRGSITDRRDFYHQAAVTPERARTNMLPFSYSLASFDDTSAGREFVERYKHCKHGTREQVGDQLGKPKRVRRSCALPLEVYPCFRSLFQGDRLGVEFALRSHEVLLQEAGLLCGDRRIEGNRPFPLSNCWEALVIDDYFCLSCEPLSSRSCEGFAAQALDLARSTYEKHELLGSPEKDICASENVKAAGAEIRSGETCVRLGFVPVAAPLTKRLALSVVSLRAASLPGVTAGFLARAVGNWVSILQYRKVWSSLVDDTFRFVATCQTDPSQLFQMPKTVAQELGMLAAVAPLVMTNVAVDFLGTCFASDASTGKGAIVEAPISAEAEQVLWLDADLKCGYMPLDNPFRAVLRGLGEFDGDEDVSNEEPFCESPGKAPLLYFDFVEICGGAGKITAALSSFGFVCAPVLDLSESRHYDLGSLELLDWIIYMLEENRFKSFFVEPPCTTFSPAAHPAVRSYRLPLGFDRSDPKTLHGNLLAFRALVLLRVGRRCKRPCGLEQSRLSKMAWLDEWRSLLDLGFSEAVVASCMFQSIHRKEFRLLVCMLDAGALDVRCCGGHSHVRIQGAYTKPSATYTDGLALHIASAFRVSLRALAASENLEPVVEGHESILSNEIMLTSRWRVVREWFWKRAGHINVLETSAAVSNLVSLAKTKSSVRFCHFVDSAVARGSLTKGRSPSRALQPLMKRAGAVCVCCDLYPGWSYAPARLNVADDPTRDRDVRSPHENSLLDFKDAGTGLRHVSQKGLRRFAANWVRLVLLASQLALSSGLSVDCAEAGERINSRRDVWVEPCACLPVPAWFWPFPSINSGAWICFELAMDFCLPTWISPVGLFLVGCVCLFLLGPHWEYRPPFPSKGHLLRRGRSRCRITAMVFYFAAVVEGAPIQPTTKADYERVLQRSGVLLVSTRAVKEQTREKRKVYLDRFRNWLWSERGVSLRFLLGSKPPDPERISGLLIEYGRALYAAGKSYGIYSETINSIAVERPLIRRQLNAAWDLAFCWLSDEPTQHHPAMPIAVMAAIVTTALIWGWPHEAAVILIGWTGIMRIGEILAATRAELVLPCDSIPGTTFALVIIKQPKTRGRSARHQAARIDQSDVIQFLTAMYGRAPSTDLLWPFSASTLRKRFSQLLAALELPVHRTSGMRPFDLGSLRPGGATWLLHCTEQPELVRRRGRWLSAKVMEIYLQEVLVTTFEAKISPSTQFRIRLAAGGFALALERTIAFLESGIPPRAWYFLLRGADGFTRDIGKNGTDGENQTFHANNDRQKAHPTSRQGGKKEGRLPDFRLTTGPMPGLKPPPTSSFPVLHSEW